MTDVTAGAAKASAGFDMSRGGMGKLLNRPDLFLAIDKGAPSADANQAHQLRLVPGKHTLTVTCDVCDANGKTVEVLVEAGKENQTFRVAAPLKPSLIGFEG